jgi:uncharacterized protein (TIGR03435 family)
MINSGHRVLCVILISAVSTTLAWSQTPVARPQFELASIKRNTSCSGRRGGGGPPTPGRLTMQCVTLQTLVANAYIVFADGVGMSSKSIDISGGPAWMLSDPYDVAAKAEDNAPYAQMAGPMMRQLLEDRFGLQVHRAAKEAQVYLLSVGKGGPNLDSTKEGSCITLDLKHPLIPTPGQPRPKICGSQSLSLKDGLVTMDSLGITMELLANDVQLTRALGRPIADKTGLNGQYDIHLQFAPEAPAAAASNEVNAPLNSPLVQSGPSIFEAFQRLGLKLEPGKGSVEVLVIDHVERPSEN